MPGQAPPRGRLSLLPALLAGGLTFALVLAGGEVPAPPDDHLTSTLPPLPPAQAAGSGRTGTQTGAVRPGRSALPRHLRRAPAHVREPQPSAEQRDRRRARRDRERRAPKRTAVAGPTKGARPASLHIPALAVEARLVRLGLDRAGALEVPSAFETAGWYRHGPRPGDAGPAVIAGHVDSYEGPAVFFRLAELSVGDRVLVRYDDGHVARFRVYHRGRFPKDEFPTSEVYGNTRAPELRLITCGGSFDARRRSYEDNVIVWARASGS